MEYPWSAIGRVSAGGRNFCTGFLIGARQVLAPASCLFYAVEGRWWQPNELYFSAGYQRENNLIGSRIAYYETAPGYHAKAGPTLANATNNWALITLLKPIARDAGWFGLRELDDYVAKQIERGKAFVIQAGYRKDWGHAITVNMGCTLSGYFTVGRAVGSNCRKLSVDSGLPFLVFIDGEFRVVGNQILNAQRRKTANLMTGGGPVVRSIRQARSTWGDSRAPARNGLAASIPYDTIDHFLKRLGLLKNSSSVSHDQDRAAAIRAFERRRGLPTTGQPSVALLGQLIEAVR